MMNTIGKVALCAMMLVIAAGCSPKQANDTAGSRGDAGSQGVQITSEATEIMPVGEEGVSMRVLYQITKYVLGTDFKGDENAVKDMLFKELDIEDTKIIFAGQVCDAVSFEKSTVKTADYLARVWHETPQHLGIEFEEVEVIKTQCPLFGFQEYMRLGDRQLVVPYEGVFYFFEPAVTL